MNFMSCPFFFKQ